MIYLREKNEIFFDNGGQGSLFDKESERKSHQKVIDKLVDEYVKEFITKYSNIIDKNRDIEIYASYDDEMPINTIAEILDSSHPEEALYDSVVDAYMDSESYYAAEIDKELERFVDEKMEKLKETDVDEYEALESILQMDIWDILNQYDVGFDYPIDHFLNETYNCIVMVDSGDANYDFTLNPNYDFESEEEIEDEASLVWLANTQGYTKEDLEKVLNGAETNSKFLKSVYYEVYNTSSHINALTFLCKATLKELIDQREEKTGIKLGTNTMCGLFDSWDGGGSILEIELEKPVTIPYNMIYQFVPDYKKCINGYSVDDVYGLVGSAYESEAELV